MNKKDMKKQRKPCTEETKRKISLALKNKLFTKERKENISIGTKLAMQRPEVKDKIKDRPIQILTENHKRNIGLGLIESYNLHPRSKEVYQKIGLKNKNKFVTLETRKKQSLAKLGCIPWNKGLTKETHKSILRLSKNRQGNKHPNWQGGTSFEDYSFNFNRNFKKIIKLRDNNCIICGSNNRLAIHHIDYNKLNTTLENSITLCNSCHSKTNFNRKYWIKFFQEYLFDKYKYPYIEVQNVS